MPGSKPGEHRGGRQKGVPNKLTTAAKQAIQLAFDDIGGVDALATWARKNRALFYTKVWVRVLPLEVKADHSGKVTLEQLVAGAAPSDDKNGDHG